MENRIPRYRLVSHPLCPYVQRAAITLAEKAIAFERSEIDLANKPEWFRRISPLGKTPLLWVGDEVLFESAVICEYLDEVEQPRLHPSDALMRARHRAWVEFASATLNTIGAFYNAPDPAALERQRRALSEKFEALEGQLGRHSGPYFGGVDFSLVDAAFAPVFRYFEVFDTIADFRCFERARRASLPGARSSRVAPRCATPCHTATTTRCVHFWWGATRHCLPSWQVQTVPRLGLTRRACGGSNRDREGPGP